MKIEIHYLNDKIKNHKGMLAAIFDRQILEFSKSISPDKPRKVYHEHGWVWGTRYATIDEESKKLIVEIHYLNKEVETHRGIRHIFLQKGNMVFSKNLDVKSSRYRTSCFQFDYAIIKEEETDGGSKNKD